MMWLTAAFLAMAEPAQLIIGDCMLSQSVAGTLDSNCSIAGLSSNMQSMKMVQNQIAQIQAHLGIVYVEPAPHPPPMPPMGPAFSDVFMFSAGGMQPFLVPNGIHHISVKVWGAAGGTGTASPSGRGGHGGYTYCGLSVTPGETLMVFVGQGGSKAAGAESALGGGGVSSGGGSGGGFSGVFVGASLTQENALIMAGGGGGSDNAGFASGGGGGDLNGHRAGNGFSSDAGTTNGPGRGGTQSAGGVGGSGGRKAGGRPGEAMKGGDSVWSGAGAGGGGYFGGGAGGGYYNAGGGGSGFVHPERCQNGHFGSTEVPDADSQVPMSDDPDYMAGDGVPTAAPAPNPNSDDKRSGNGLVVIATHVPPSPPPPTPPPPPPYPPGTTHHMMTFEYTGALQHYEVPTGITTLIVNLWGAAGGTGVIDNGNKPGGNGAFVSCTLSVTAGETLTLLVGEGGQLRGVAKDTGTFGGGGNTGSNAGQGGGLSGIFSANDPTQDSALIIAGGGGGSDSAGFAAGGAGGHPEGSRAGNGFSSDAGTTNGPGRGGTQSAGGVGGSGGRKAGGRPGEAMKGGDSVWSGAGAGGGGYFGGGAGGGYYNAGGGGSSYTHANRCSDVKHLGVSTGRAAAGANERGYAEPAGVSAIGTRSSQAASGPSGNGLIVLMYPLGVIDR